MKSQKGIIHIGLIIILLIFGIGALIFVMYKTNSLPVVTTTSSPTPNSTPAPITTPEGWLEYKLPGIGLTFFYPADAKVDTKSSHTLGVGSKYQGPILVNISKYGQTQGLDTELYDGYSFSIAKIALNSESLQKIAQDSISFNTSEFGQETLIKPLSTITIGGKTGYTYTIQSLGQYTHILLPLDEKSFLLITYSAPDPNNQGYQKIIDQILSTFEFVDQDSLFSKRLYNIDDKLIGKQPLPTEIVNLKDNQLVDISCSPIYDYDSAGKYIAYLDNSKTLELTDPILLKITRSNSSISNISSCKTYDGKIIVQYLIAAGGGGAGNTSYFGFANSNGELEETIKIVNDGAPYFGCGRPFALTTNNMFYYGCSGGDGGFSQASVYKINMTTLQATKLIKCTSTVNPSASTPEETSTVQCE